MHIVSSIIPLAILASIVASLPVPQVNYGSGAEMFDADRERIEKRFKECNWAAGGSSPECDKERDTEVQIAKEKWAEKQRAKARSERTISNPTEEEQNKPEWRSANAREAGAWKRYYECLDGGKVTVETCDQQLEKNLESSGKKPVWAAKLQQPGGALTPAFGPRQQRRVQPNSRNLQGNTRIAPMQSTTRSPQRTNPSLTQSVGNTARTFRNGAVSNARQVKNTVMPWYHNTAVPWAKKNGNAIAGGVLGLGAWASGIPGAAWGAAVEAGTVAGQVGSVLLNSN